MHANLHKNRRGIWEIRFSEKTPAGWRSRTVSTGETDRAPAEEFLAGWLGAVTQAKNSAAAQTFDRLAELYLSDTAGQRASRGQEFSLKFPREAFGRLAATDVTPEVLAQYRADRAAGVFGRSPAKPGTLDKELRAVGTVFAHAVKVRALGAGDAPYIARPAPPPPRAVWLNETQEQELLALAAATSAGQARLTRIHRFVWIALHTGSRRGAIERLRWEHVDFARGLIDFEAAQPSSRYKRRVMVPISSGLRPVLEQAHREAVSDWVLDGPGKLLDLFCAWVSQTPYPHVRPHDLRRTWATLSARAGVSLWEIAGVLGDSVEMVARVYAKHAPDHLRSAVERRAAAPARA